MASSISSSAVVLEGMMNIGRQANELWIDFEARSLRLARMMIHKHDGKRWGDRHVEAYWDFAGHRVRGIEREFPSAAHKLSWYRGLPWWQEEQKKDSGRRHGRHFPHLMNSARKVSRAVNTPAWREAALDRGAWANRSQEWCKQTAVAWSSGRQLALPDME